MTEKSSKQPALVNIPSRTSSNQKFSELNSTVPAAPAVPNEPPPSPRRGSKRSLLSRSRNNSKSSRKSARAARTADSSKEPIPSLPQNEASRPEKKTRSGFLAFLNCCSPQEDFDASKSDDPDVAAKKIKIQPTAQRAPRPQEHTEVTENEKPLEKVGTEANSSQGATASERNGELSEKNPLEDSRPKISSEEATHQRVAPVSSGTIPNSTLKDAGSSEHEVASSSQQDQLKTTTLVLPDQITAPNVNIISPTPVEPEHPTNVQRQDGNSKRSSDVEMPDATDGSAIEEEPLDEPPQPAEQLPHAPLPPPPPLVKRQEQVGTKEVPPVPEANPEKTAWLLPPIQPHLQGRKCLVLDLDETLVHSSFKILNQADFTIPVEIEGQYHNVYVIKRPGVDAFMKRVGELYEVVVFTASVSKYGDPLLDQLDIHHVVHHRLFRESCYNHQGNYVKDLSQVGRDLKETIIIDNSPTSYIFHPQHAVPISSWFSDAHDNELLDLIPVLEDLAGPKVQDVSLVLDVAL
ncbi:uncharacterized protein A1O9_07119 [Exophiala aquamarina CBS 119918]|uniref:FCP1 homology domain-containing protein n=1 Tax=Exophiala aquamarina CBS 119918 TaxID=1182545 RepID=A0A072P9Z3_9EURO|nr:uncharacterized protein A1O9_07119 [Exophiala aquamarina CBS 119918]KEF56929.1 hypothetical protein A1O9_07119 [Exophiala aquamarina CBS 119918]